MLLKREKSPGLSLKTFTQKPRNSRLINQPSTCLALGFQGRMTWSHSASFPPVISFPQISQRNSFVFEYFQHVREKTMLFFSSRTLHPAKFSHVTVSQPRIDQPWKTKRESDISSSNDRVTLDPKCRFARFPRFTRAITSAPQQTKFTFVSSPAKIPSTRLIFQGGGGGGEREKNVHGKFTRGAPRGLLRRVHLVLRPFSSIRWGCESR